MTMSFKYFKNLITHFQIEKQNAFHLKNCKKLFFLLSSLFTTTTQLQNLKPTFLAKTKGEHGLQYQHMFFSTKQKDKTSFNINEFFFTFIDCA